MFATALRLTRSLKQVQCAAAAQACKFLGTIGFEARTDQRTPHRPGLHPDT